MTTLVNSFASRLAVVVLIMAVPLFLITTNLNIVINSGWLYNFGFERYSIEESTGIENVEPEYLCGQRAENLWSSVGHAPGDRCLECLMRATEQGLPLFEEEVSGN